MEINTAVCTVNGIYHTSRGKENEDCVKLYETDTILVAAVADGCSSCNFGCVASQATVEGAIAFAQDPHIWDYNKKQLKTRLIQSLDTSYFDTREAYGQLQSTLTLLVINKISKQFLSMSIGDSSAITLNKAMENPEILAAPMHIGGSNARTIFANATGAEAMMHVSTGDCEDMSGFLLLTDGAQILLQEESTPEIQELMALTMLNPDVGRDRLETLCNQWRDTGHDDVTVCVIGLQNPVTKEIARQLYPDVVETTSAPEEGRAPEEELPEKAAPEAPSEPMASSDREPGEADAVFSILQFCMQPKTPTEIVEAGFCRATELLIFLRPLLMEGLLSYNDDHTFGTMFYEDAT